MKKILLTIIQVGVTVGLLIWVFHDPTQRAQMAKALRLADYRWVAAGVLAYVVVEIAAAIRWQVLLRVQKIRLSTSRLAGLFMIGIFYNQFLPGGTGGDIIKSYLLLKETPDHKAGALLAVVFDRLIGLVALVVITATLVGIRYRWLAQTPETRNLVWILMLLLGVSLASLFASFIISGFNLFHLLPHKFPGRDKLIEIAAAYHLYARHWIATFFAFVASLVAHLATFTTFCVSPMHFTRTLRSWIYSRFFQSSERSRPCPLVSRASACANKFCRSCCIICAASKSRSPSSSAQ